MEIWVEPDGTMDGEGSCSWSSDEADGEFDFTVNASVEPDSNVEGSVFVDGGGFGAADKPIDFGMHREDETKLVWAFELYSQTHTVEFERD